MQSVGGPGGVDHDAPTVSHPNRLLRGYNLSGTPVA